MDSKCQWCLWFETFQYPLDINIHNFLLKHFNIYKISISTKINKLTFKYPQSIKIHKFSTFYYLQNINIHNSWWKITIFIKLCDEKNLKTFHLKLGVLFSCSIYLSSNSKGDFGCPHLNRNSMTLTPLPMKWNKIKIWSIKK